MELDEYQTTVLREASKTRGKGGNACKSAARHVERALALKDNMPEVSVFLAITAEEEAATAVFCALRKRKYQGANRLNDRDHVFKAGLYPFIQLLGNTVGAIKYNYPLQLFFQPNEDKTHDELLRVRMALTSSGLSGPCLEPNPPLNLVSVNEDGTKTDYLKAVKDIATEKGIDSIHKYIRNLSNVRNEMLYASDVGIPCVENAEELLGPRIRGVFSNLSVYLLIEPHSIQNFPQEALTAFLGIRRGLEGRET